MARRRRLDACRQVAFSHPFGDRDQVADGTRQLGRQGEADPRRRQQQKQSHDHEDHDERDLDSLAPLLQALILGNRLVGEFDVLEDSGFDEAADQQVSVGEAVQLDQGTHPVLRAAGQDNDLARGGLLQIPAQQPFQFQGQTEPRAGQGAAVAVHHHGLGKGTQARLGRKYLVKAHRLRIKKGASRLRSLAIAKASARMFCWCSCR